MMTEKQAELIGIPFEFGGRGGKSYDCYGLVRDLYLEEHGVLIPDYKSPSDAPRVNALFAGNINLWEETERFPGTVVLLNARIFNHVGYVISNTHFMHTWACSGGVVCEPLSEWERRIVGFYKYVGT